MQHLRIALVACAMVVCASSLAFGDGTTPRDARLPFGDVDSSRTLPRGIVKHVPMPDPRKGDGRYRSFGVVLELPGMGSLVLDRYLQDPEGDTTYPPPNVLARACVSGDEVQIGWLRGASDILLLHWVDASSCGASGPSPYGCYMLARVAPKGLSELLRYKVLLSASATHSSLDLGIGSCRFSFDAESKTCRMTARFHKAMESKTPAPLCSERVGGAMDGFSRGVLDEEVTATYTYRHGRLQLSSAGLVYLSQDKDTCHDIARYYLGQRASGNAIAQINPSLVEVLPKGARIPYARIPARTRVSIPLPAEWLAEYYRIPLETASADSQPKRPSGE